MSATITPVILCGGHGTRLWPISRRAFPKQFVVIDGDLSTFQQTALRVSGTSLFNAPIVIAANDHRFIAKRQLATINRDARILLEPEPRESGPALLAGAMLETLADNPDALMLFLAADHDIPDRSGFVQTCVEGLPAASSGHIVTFGIKVTAPETRYGYINPGEALDESARTVKAFIEKPDLERAALYRKQGYLWNSGNFLVRADVLIEEYEKRSPETVVAVKRAVQGATFDLGFTKLDPAAFGEAQKQSIDYAVMEHTKKAAVVTARFGWSDLGTWDAYWQHKPHDEQGNVFLSATEAVETTDCLTLSDEALISLVGVRDLVVVATRDAVLVANRHEADKVKTLVAQMKRANRPQADTHSRCDRPWGWYQTLDLGARFQVKRIVVYSGERLSLQKHFHRAEHWVVVSGTALVTNGETQMLLRENESTYITLGNVHRLENPGKIDLELIEVQSGSYLGEDDIVRLEDVYART